MLGAARLAAEAKNADALARAALANKRGMSASGVGEVDEERIAVVEAALDAIGSDDTVFRARLTAALGDETPPDRRARPVGLLVHQRARGAWPREHPRERDIVPRRGASVLAGRMP